MAKRKQHEPTLVCLDSNIEVAEGVALGNEVPVSQGANGEGVPATNCGTGKVNGPTGVSIPSPSVTRRPLTVEEQTAEAFWALLERDGYTIW